MVTCTCITLTEMVDGIRIMSTSLSAYSVALKALFSNSLTIHGIINQMKLNDTKHVYCTLVHPAYSLEDNTVLSFSGQSKLHQLTSCMSQIPGQSPKVRIQHDKQIRKEVSVPRTLPT